MKSIIQELERLCIDDPREAIARAEKAMESASRQTLPRLCSISGAAYRRLADLKQAYHTLHKGLELAKEYGDDDAEADLLQRIAYVFGDHGDYPRALATSESASMRFLKAGDLAGCGRSMFAQGMWLYYLEEFGKSTKVCRAAFRLLPAAEVDHRFAALQCMALAFMETRDLRRARRYAKLAQTFEGQIAASMWAKQLWLDAKLLKREGAFRDAEKALQSALDHFLEIGASLDVAFACIEITTIIIQNGEPGRAREVATSYGRLLVSSPTLADNPLASAAIMELVRCSVTGDNLEVVLKRLRRRLEQASTRSRLSP